MAEQPLDESALNPYSREFARALFAEFPWMRAHANVDTLPKVDPGSLWVSVPSPGDPCGRTLDISTDGGEVTIFFAFSHVHVSWPPDAGHVDGALDILAGVFGDEYLAEDSFRGRKWTRSSFPARGAEMEPPTEVITVISSWSGRLDRVIDRTVPGDSRGRP